MKCEHNDCFTCPYPDCIKNSEPIKRKCGRKALSPEEKKRRKKIYNATYRKKHKAEEHEKYLKRTEGIVKRRYKKKVVEGEA